MYTWTILGYNNGDLVIGDDAPRAIIARFWRYRRVARLSLSSYICGLFPTRRGGSALNAHFGRDEFFILQRRFKGIFFLIILWHVLGD